MWSDYMYISKIANSIFDNFELSNEASKDTTSYTVKT